MRPAPTEPSPTPTGVGLSLPHLYRTDYLRYSSAMEKLALVAVAVVALGAAAWFNRVRLADLAYRLNQLRLPAPVARREAATSSAATLPTPSSTAPAQPAPRPTAVNLAVPFTTQAPFADWGQPWLDSCEEAALLNVHYYWTDRKFTPAVARDEIMGLVNYQNELLGSPTGYLNSDAAATGRIAEGYWGTYRSRVVYDWTVGDMEAELAAGRPVIVFVHGKALRNPNFRNGGSLYHALVVRGYTADSFIANDVGTRRGEGYLYGKQLLLEASHDYNGGDVLSGRRAMLVLTPKD